MAAQPSAEVRRRSAGFLVVLAASGVVALMLRGNPGQSGPVFHTVTEAVATVLGFVVGALALVRYHSRRDDLVLLVGAGFLGAAFLDVYHALVTSPGLAGRGALVLESVSPWSWLASRFFLSIFLLLSVLAWIREKRGGHARVEESAVYGTVAVMASASFLVFAILPMPRALYPDFPLHRPQELVAGAFFLAAFVIYYREGGWRRNAFAHWLAVALLLSASAQLFFMPFSGALHDRWYDAAHLVKVLSYAAVVTGLLESVFHTYRRLEENTLELEGANALLEREVQVRQEAEAQLHEREERLADFLDHAHDLIQITGPDGRIQYVNDAWRSTLGFGPGEAEGVRFLDLVEGDHRVAVSTALRRAMGGDDVVDLKTVLVTRAGQRVTVVGSLNCRFESGSPVATRAIFRDVTEAERTRHELEIEKTYLERLFENAPEAIVLMDGDERVVRVNEEFTRLFGYVRGEVVGHTINELIVPPEERTAASEVTHRVTAGETVSFEAVRQRKDGERLDVSVLGTPMRLADGTQAVYGIYRDVGERKRTQERLRETVEKLEALVLASPLAIMTLDLEGRVGLWNPAAEMMFGWTESEVLGGPVPFVGQGEEDTFRDVFGRSIAGEPLSNLELVRSRRDGTPIHVSISSAPLYRADGAVTGLMAVVNDVSDRKLAEQALARAKLQAEEANRAKSEFLARMSHELRTPLNSVIGFTKVLLKNRHERMAESDLNFLGRIAANGEHLLELINDILDLSKIEAGKMQLELGPVDLRELVEETVGQLEGRVLSDQVRLTAELPAALEPLQADRHKLKQVLINLVGNALKFTEQGQVTVGVRTVEGSARPLSLDVSDTGIGIPEDRLARIFEAFEQAEESTTRKYGGTGLGLSISHRLTEMMGYRLEVRSQLGRGSTFSIVFDPGEAPAGRHAGDAAAGPGGTGADGDVSPGPLH